MRFPRHRVWTTFIVSWIVVVAAGYRWHRDGLAPMLSLQQYRLQGRLSWPWMVLAAIALVLGIGSTLILLFGKAVPRQAEPPPPPLKPEGTKEYRTDR